MLIPISSDLKCPTSFQAADFDRYWSRAEYRARCDTQTRGRFERIDGRIAKIETGDSDYEPDAFVNGDPPIADDAVAAPNPVIVVEVLSPGTASTDTGGKLAGYCVAPRRGT